jgi:hypothetical protein
VKGWKGGNGGVTGLKMCLINARVYGERVARLLWSQPQSTVPGSCLFITTSLARHVRFDLDLACAQF